MKRELGIGRCGLACCLCSENAHCNGCSSGECPDKDWCENRSCSIAKGLEHCYECDQDCQKGLLAKIKPHAFTVFAERYGEDMLLDCLERNEKKGIVYHREGITGDYDDFADEEELIRFILTGNRNKDRNIAYCGLDCTKCDAYIATMNNDDELREKTAKLWTKLNGVEILPEQIDCEGCRMDGKKTVFCGSLCQIRQCALKKGLETCGDCEQMADCETLKAITSNSPEALDNLRLKVISYYESERPEHWLKKIEESEWRGSAYLCKLLSDGTFFSTLGDSSRLLLLTRGDELLSFCTYAEKDDIRPADLKPWIGYIYTFPQYRGHRYLKHLFEMIEELAGKEGIKEVYISTDHEGLYEKYGFEYLREMKNIHGDPSRVYVKRINK